MKFKNILLTGVSGQVGHAIRPVLSEYNLTALSRDELNLLDKNQISSVIHRLRPDLIINPAAYTAVDKAESEPNIAFAVNAEATAEIAKAAKQVGAALIHFSTDYVYDGEKESPYLETDNVNPQSIYGKSKLAGEQAIVQAGLPYLILRTSWIYGHYGSNFLKTILNLAERKESLNIVSDQYGAPTSSRSVAHAIYYIIKQWDSQEPQQSGVYHVSNSGRTSWYEFAKEILKLYKQQDKIPLLKLMDDKIYPIPTIDYPVPAPRPKNSCLDNSKLHKAFGVSLPNWRHSLQEVMQRIN